MKKIFYALIFLLFHFSSIAQIDLELSLDTVITCKSVSVQSCVSNVTNVVPTPINDDIFTDTINLGFNFSFYGTSYSQVVLSPNNFLSFNLSLAGIFSEWNYTTALAANQLDKAIMFPFQDLNITQTGKLKYKTVGKAPYRKFVVEFCSMPYFFCPTSTTTNQLILFETTNVIEMHLGSKPNCVGWTGSTAAYSIQGLKSGSSQVFVPGRGPADPGWTTSNTANRFTPSGGTYTISTIGYNPVDLIDPNTGTFEWFEQGSTTPFASTPCASIITSPFIHYYVVKYTGTLGCGNPVPQTLFDTVRVIYTSVIQPITLTYCSNQLPVTWNGMVIPAGTTTQSHFDTVVVATSGCDNIYDVNLVINSAIPSNFNQIAPICSGSGFFNLPTSSTNGISGTWSPSPNFNTTTTYTFTPGPGQCANTATMTVQVTPSATPTFTQVAPVCVGSAMAPLPTTSTNGVTGVWTPALNNTTTTTYLFTPVSTAICNSTTTMTIVVNQKIVPTFNNYPPVCSGVTMTPLATTSLNGIQGTWSPALNNNATTIYTFTPNPGQCGFSITDTIIVNNSSSLPTFAPIVPFCFGLPTTALPTTSLNGIVGTWSPALNNSTTTTYTFTPTNLLCGTTAQLTVPVNPNITPTFNPIPPRCQGTLAPNPLRDTSLNGYIGTWSPAFNPNQTTTYTFTPNPGQGCILTTTLTVAIVASIAPEFMLPDTLCIGSSLTFPTTSDNNIPGTWSPAFNPNATTLYTFTPLVSVICYSAGTHTVAIQPLITPTFNYVAPVCYGALGTPLLTTSLNGITGTWSPAFDNTTTGFYTFTPDPNQCATTTSKYVTIYTSTTVPTFNLIDSACQYSNLPPLPTTSFNGIDGTWSPALNNNATTVYTFTPNNGQCGMVVTHTIVIKNLVVPSFAAVGPFCLGAVVPTLPTTSTNGITGTWSPAINSLVTSTYTFTPTAGQCASSTTMTIIISNGQPPIFTLLDSVCSNATVSPLPTISNNGVVGTWSPAFNNTASTVYTFTPAGPASCATTITHTLHIKTPSITTFAQMPAVCSGGLFTPLPTVSQEGIIGTWSPAANNMATTTYTFTPSSSFCATSPQMTVVVNSINAIPLFDTIPNICYGSVGQPLPTLSLNGIVGTWTPSIVNSLVTSTYNFVPTYCGTTTSLVVVVDTVVNPIFTQVPPICIGGTLNPLPQVSNNGVKGLWSPAINPNATTTYTFTPLAGSCANLAHMTIVVNPITTATFAPVGPYCSGATIPALPTTSQNGITGTWTPSVNNLATTGYSFVADSGQCVLVPTTLTITISPIITPTFSPVADVCFGSNMNPLPTTSTNGITGTWSPALNNSATTTYTFTPSAGLCASTASLTVVVIPIVPAIFTQVPPICVGGTLLPLPTTSNNGYSGTWSPALNNQVTTTYSFSPLSGTCVGAGNMTIVVNPIVIPTFAPVSPYCQGSTIPALPITSTNGITGSWSPSINNIATTTYTFSTTPAPCLIDTTTLTIVITPEIIPVFPVVNPICFGGSLSPLPTTSTNGVTGIWSPALNNSATTTYTFTPNAGQCSPIVTSTIVVNPIVPPTFTQVAPICAGATLAALPTTSINGFAGTWSPAINNAATTTYLFTPTAGTCVDTATMTIVVNPLITPNFTPVGPYCSGAVIPALPLTSNNGITGTWSPTINNLTTTTYTFSTNAGPCVVNNTTLSIVVTPIIIPTFTQIPPVCIGSALIPLPTTSTNGVSGTWSPALNSSATTTYTFTPNAGQCSPTTTMTIVVNPVITPVFTQVAPICQGNVLAPLPTTSNNGVAGTWTPTINNSSTTMYTFTPFGAGACLIPTTMQIVVNPYLIGTRNIVICGNSSYVFNGITYTSSISGVKDTIPNSNSCDSIITLNLLVHPLTYSIKSATICQGSSYTFNGIVYMSSNNTAKDTFLNQFGCDSIVTLNLTVIPVNPTTSSANLNGCSVVFFHGNSYLSDTTFIDTTYTTLGCDSNYNTVRIKVYPSYNEVVETRIDGCNRVDYNGIVYTHDAYFEELIKTTHGCDSFFHKVWISVDSFKLNLEMDPLLPYRNEEVRFKTTGSPSNNYTVLSWEPSNLFSNQSAYSQRIIMDQPMTVTVIGQLGICKDTAIIDIIDLPEIDTNIRMPNAFSPNGDGTNDVFRPVFKAGHGYNFADFSIFNRYGQKIYNTNNIGSGWDGYYKGVLQDVGVYYYRVVVKFANGTEKVFTGDLTLIK